MTFNMKALKIVIAGVLVAAALLLVFGIPVNFLVNSVQSRIESETGYHVTIDGGAKIGLRPSPTVWLRNITLLGRPGTAAQSQYKIGSVRVALSFFDLLRGRARITQLTISHPSLRLPLVRERIPPPASAPPADGGETKNAPTIDRIRVEDGTVGFYNGPDHLESSIEHINLDVLLSSADGRASVNGSLSWGGRKIALELKSNGLPQRLEGRAIPVEIELRAPGLWEQPLSAKAELRSRRNSLAINALTGKVGESNFNGWATLDFAANKPLVKGDFDFDHLHIGFASDHRDAARQNTLGQPWSDREIKFEGLNFCDAELRVSAAELSLDSFRLAPVTIEATIAKGVLEAKLTDAGIYGGKANGVVSLDASGPAPAHALQVHLDGANALPLLSDAAGFASLEGTMQANVDVKATGGSQRAMASSLAGTVDAGLSNGAVRGIDVAKLMHHLTSTILNGWQQNAADKTPLADLNVRFSLANGVATTDKLELSGPIVRMTGTGTVDIGAKTLQMKVDPRLVAGLQGSNGGTGATGLGVPVIIEGSWSEPRIYPDVAGILDNPDGVFSQLKAAGKGLFGDANRSGNNGTIGNIIQGLGNMFNTPAGKRRDLPGSEQ